MSLSRRVFLGWSSLAALWTTRRAAIAQPAPSGWQASPRELPGLDTRALRPLAEAVLPAELGTGRIAAATTAFALWIAGYREGEELLHPYGSERISVTGPSPAAKWTTQLAALDAAAQATHHTAFASVTTIQRAALVRDALAGVQFNARVPSPSAAPHVALALLAHFLDSPDATNLAYGRAINARQCRPLQDSVREPVALRRAGGA